MSTKREWPTIYDDDDNDDVHVKRQKLLGNFSHRSHPLTELNTGLISPPVTPEKDDRLKKYANLHPKEHTVRRLNFAEEAHSPYAEAKRIFLRGSANELQDGEYCLPGRQNEAKLLKQYIEESLVSLRSTSIYVSGPPGTGKTAQVNAILDSLIIPGCQNSAPGSNVYEISLPRQGREVHRKFRVIKVNCMTLRSPEEIFYTVEDNITGTENKRSFSRDKLKEQLTDKTTCDTTILVLDEMDSVINKYQQTLFELFSWASNLPSVGLGDYQPGLILVGIANALDLTDRFLPRLRSNRINPKLVQFLPYTADQICEVITAKLYSLNPKDNGKLPPPIVHPVAIKLCSKKAAVNTGDLRKAFDIIHRAIEVVEQMTMKRLSGERFERLTLDTAPKVMIAQIARVCNSAFDTNYQLKLEALNFQAKAVLCCLFKFEEKKNSPITDPSFKKGLARKKCTKLIPSINSFFEFYSRYLKSVDRMLSTLKRSEFLEVLNTLESNSLINLSLLADNLNKFTSGMVNSNGNGNSNKLVISFGNYQISTNVPKSELLKAIGKIEILGKVMMGSGLN